MNGNTLHTTKLSHITTIRNPIIPGFNPDPSIICVNGDYFLTTSTFEYTPGLPIYHSRGTDDIWDETSWSDPIYFDVLGIDQDLFFDDDDQVYLSVATKIVDPTIQHEGFNLAVHTTRIDPTTGRSLSPLQLTKTSQVGNGCCEGSHIFKKGSFYYLLTAEGGTEVEHQEFISRSTVGPLGPWETGKVDTINPIVYNGDHHEIRQTGHMDMVEGPDGRWWAVFLGVRPVWDGGKEPRLSQLGRETFLAEVQWEDDWPVVNKRRPVSINDTESFQNFDQQFSFAPDSKLSLDGWYRMRTPQSNQDHSLTAFPGKLTLYGSPIDIRENEAPTMFLQKQQGFTGTWSLRLEYSPSRQGHEAGTAVWWSKWCFASLGIRAAVNGSQELVFRYPDPDTDEFRETIFERPGPGTIEVSIKAIPTLYTFSFRQIGTEAWIQAGSISSSVLVRTRSFDSIFTGTHFAIYAMGCNSQGSNEPASFDSVRWHNP